MIGRAVCLLLIGLAAGLPASGPARAASPDAGSIEISGVRVGFAGRYRLGVWTPVDVLIRGAAEPTPVEVVVTVPDGDGIPTHVSTDPAQPVTLAAGQEHRVRLYAKFGRLRGTLQVEVRRGEKRLARRTFNAGDDAALPPAIDRQPLIVVVGPAAAVEEAVRYQGLEPGERPIVATIDDVAQLPDRWFGYEGVETLAFLTSEPKQLEAFAGHTQQAAALVEWVRLGGQVLIGAGAEAKTLLGDGAPLAALRPGKLEGTIPLRQTGAIETFCRSSTPLIQGATDRPMQVARLADVEGLVEVREATLPLVVRAAHGLGQVTFLAADVDRSPLADWSDRGALLARLLDLTAATGDETSEAGGRLHFGYRDMAGHLRSTLDRFEGVGVVPFWIVAGAAVVYLLLIGPADYFLLRRSGVRMQWTWLSFGLLVLLFAGLAVALVRGTKGRELHVHQAEVLDVDLATRRVRGTAWFNLYSPEARQYDIALRPTATLAAGEPETLVSWQGLAGRALGGMSVEAAMAQPLGETASYAFGPRLGALDGVPMHVWSSKSFIARWQAAAADALHADLREEARLPVGIIENRTSVTLTDALLAYERWAYQLGTLGPGESVRLGTNTRRSELKTVLTGRKIVFTEAKDKYHQATTPYDQTSLDAAYVLRAMMFHEAAGGDRYTGLRHELQRFVDLSGLLRCGRAVLVARVEGDGLRQASTVVCDERPTTDASQRTLFYRFVIPVETTR